MPSLTGYMCCSMWSTTVTENRLQSHDDVIKWKQFPRYWPFVRGIHRSPVNSPHKGQLRGALMFSFTCVWMNGLVNNRKAGDLRRYRAHYDVILMQALTLVEYIWWFWRQKQVYQARVSNCIPQHTVICNYLSLSEIPASGTKVLIWGLFYLYMSPRPWKMNKTYIIYIIIYMIIQYKITGCNSLAMA